jgi:hypothetical protein
VIDIVQRPGAASLALSKLPSGATELTISGTGAGLLTAARAVSSPAVAALTGSSSIVPADLVGELRHSPVPTRAILTPVTVKGKGTLTLTTSFFLPLGRVLTDTIPMQIATAYNSPSGGRVTVSLGGAPLGGYNVPANGAVQRVKTYKLAADPTLASDLFPGWWAHPGPNEVQVSAQPQGSSQAGLSSLRLLSGSRLKLKTAPRPATLQLGLWPFPIYDQNVWSHATVVLSPGTDTGTLGALIGALSNSARVTGVPADPQVAFGALTPAQLEGNLIVVGTAAANGTLARVPAVHGLKVAQAPLNGLLDEVKVHGGGIALLADGARALNALAQGYAPGTVLGKAVVIDAHGHAHVLEAGQQVPLFKAPRWPWLAPSALLAILAFGWLLTATRRARRRLVAMPKFQVADGGAA